MTNQEIKTISIDHIIKPADQQRLDIDDGKMDELRQSIRDHGLINPITVRKVKDGFELIAGSRRLKCHELLNLPLISAIILEVDELEADILRAHENEFRHDPNPVESGIYISKLKDKHNLSVAEIAKQLNQSQTYVRGRLDLMTYPDYFLEPIARSEMSVAVAKHLIQIEPDTKRRQYVAWAVWRGITGDQASAWLQHARIGAPIQSAEELPNAEAKEKSDVYTMQADCFICKQKDDIRNLGMVYAHQSCEIQKALDSAQSPPHQPQT